MRVFIIFFILAILSILTSFAYGQAYSFRATFGEESLPPDFEPDPFTVEVNAGGIIDAEELGYNCFGMIANDPDFRLYYEVSDTPLFISVISSEDTTVVVTSPSGDWFCDDDSAGELNPLLELYITENGPYDIWVGTIGVEGLAAGVLSISEYSLLGVEGGVIEILPDFP